MRYPKNYWSIPKIKEEALQYDTKKEFTQKSKGAYMAGWRLGIIDEVCSHMSSIITHKHPKAKLFKEAQKYKSRLEFNKGSLWAYKASIKYDILDEVCSHMSKNNTIKYTKESLQKMVNGYTHLSELYTNKDAAGAAKRLGLYEDLTKNLIRGKGGFNPDLPASFYFIRVNHLGNVFYKYGITNRSVDDRYNKKDRCKMVVLYEARFKNGIDAYNIEKSIKSDYQNLHYKGSDKILEGAMNTEILTSPVSLY